MIYVNSVSVYPKRLSLKVGEWYYYTSVEICPTNASCKDIVWSSDNPSVASVNASNGYIYAKSEGTATIYAMATDGSRCSDSISVNVESGSENIYVSSVKLDRSKATIEVCETLLLTASVYPENATNRSVTWNTSNASVATVHNGIVYASSKGTATITATAADGSGKSASCVVTVTDEILVTSIQMENSVYNLTLGKSDYIKATIRPQNAANKNIAWSSSDPCVVTVNPSSGLVYARNLGTATISAVAQDGSNQSAHCTIMVKNVPVKGICISHKNITLRKGTSKKLTADILPGNATNKNIIWTSCDEKIAIVYDDGTITATGIGKTTVSAISQSDNSIFTECLITVLPPIAVESVAVSPNHKSMNIGETATLTATVLPNNATNKTVKWSSSDIDIVEVDASTGEILCHDAGEVIITATCVDGRHNGYCRVKVSSPDPFHQTNIKSIRLKKWKSAKTKNGVHYSECIMSTVATESYVNNLKYFSVIFPDENEFTTFEINESLKNQLDKIEKEYDRQFIKAGRPLCFHKGKQYADIFVNEGKISSESIEYYGIWAYNGNAICQIYDRLDLAFALASIAYSGFTYGFKKVISMQLEQMTIGQTKSYNGSSYKNSVQSQKAISDISDDIAVQSGKTDTSLYANGRRSWRASELKASEIYTCDDGYRYNKSYIKTSEGLVQVSHGTPHSQRPDFFNPETNHIVEVKNYTITTATGRQNLANNIASQYNNRQVMFPNATIDFVVDIYGQAYTSEMIDDVLSRVYELLGSSDMINFIN